MAFSLVAEHMWVFFYVRKRKEHGGNVRARKGKKVRANAVGGAQESTLRTVRRETQILDQWETEEKVSCLMMSGAARAFHGFPR